VAQSYDHHILDINFKIRFIWSSGIFSLLNKKYDFETKISPDSKTTTTIRFFLNNKVKTVMCYNLQSIKKNQIWIDLYYSA